MKRMCGGATVIISIWSVTLTFSAVIQEQTSKPYFVNTNQLEVNSTSGKTVYLRCRVRHLGANTVVWLREKDLHILTYDIYTYTSEDQFESLHAVDSDEWILMIRHPQVKDSGTYACQVSSEPYISQYYHLNIFAPKTKILGNSEHHFRKGGDIVLTCAVMEALDPTEDVFWLHEEEVLNNIVSEDINIVTDRETGNSQLTIADAQTEYSGNYTCTLSNYDSDTVIVFVLEHVQQESDGVS